MDQVLSADAEQAIDTLARTLFGEARGEGRAGMEAVAAVVLNRARNPRWWGHDVTSVCRAPYQFSCWLASDPNRPKLESVSARGNPEFVTALAVAQEAVCGALRDPTGGADSYFATSIRAPAWAARAVRTCVIGHHAFYRVELPAPATVTPATPQGLPVAPTHSVNAPAEVTADDLMAAELAQLGITPC